MLGGHIPHNYLLQVFLLLFYFPQTILVEMTHMDAAVGFAYTAATKGYTSVVVVPGQMPTHMRSLLQSFGATVELTSLASGMRVGKILTMWCVLSLLQLLRLNIQE